MDVRNIIIDNVWNFDDLVWFEHIFSLQQFPTDATQFSNHFDNWGRHFISISNSFWFNIILREEL